MAVPVQLIQVGMPTPVRGTLLALQFGLDQLCLDRDALSDNERRRASTFLTTELSSRYANAHVVLRAALGTATGRTADAVDIATGTNGKPWLPDHPECQFNLSHSADQALVVIGAMPLGVDLEAASPTLCDDEGLARWVLDPAALAAWLRQPAGLRAETLCRAWTLKEAFVKARGTGLGDEPLSALRLPDSGVGPIAPGDGGGPAWWVRPLPAPWGYHAALCTSGMPPPLRIFRYSDDGWRATDDVEPM